MEAMLKRTVLIALACMAFAAPAFAKTKIFVSMARSDDKFLNILRNAVAAEAAKDPDIDITIVDAHNDSAAQVEQVRDALAGKPDVVMTETVDDDAARGIAGLIGKTPLVYLNRRPPMDRFAGKVAIVSSNDLVAGRLQMRLVAEKIGDKGNIVILRGQDGHPAAIERTQGVKEIVAGRPNIHLVEEATGDWSRAEGERLVTQWLNSGEHIDAVLANNDEMALGAITALKKAGIPPGKVIVAGVDGTADALAEIRSGYLTLSLLQNANAQGSEALIDAKKLADNQYAELYDWVPYELIIPSNLQKYAGQ